MNSEMRDVALEPSAPPPTIADLEPVSWLISNHRNRELFLEELDAKRRDIAEEILQSATKLEQSTGWSGETLVRWLGCPATTVGAFRELKSERLKISNEYLRYLEELSALVETEFDKRTLILGYGKVYLLVDGDTGMVKKAFETKTDGISPYEYVELGEVQAALDLVLDSIDPDSFEQIRTPFDGRPPVHISTSRLDALIRKDGEFDLPGPLANRMREHIKECSGCKEAYAYRKERLHSSMSFPQTYH
jgi:hypothetical protein